MAFVKYQGQLVIGIISITRCNARKRKISITTFLASYINHVEKRAK